MSDRVVTHITPHVRRLEAPADLRRLQGWIIWRTEYEPGTDKPRKIPYWANGQKRFGRQGSAADKAKLVPFSVAKESAAKRGFDGVGLALLPEWGVTALDFDYCIDTDGNETKLPNEIAEIVADTYAEVSPSGKGVRAFFKGDMGSHKSPRSHADGWGFETFNTSGWVTFTGDALFTTELLGREETVAPVTDKVRALCDRRFGADRVSTTGIVDEEDPFAGIAQKAEISLAQAKELLSDLDPGMNRDPWIKVGMALWHEYDGDYEAFVAWDEWSSSAHNYPGTEALEQQWDSIARRVQTRGRPTTMWTVVAMSKEARKADGLEAREIVNEDLDKAIAAAQEALKGEPPARVDTPEDYAGKFKIISSTDYALRDPPKWIIKGVLPDADVGVIYGASGAGKSFIVLELALHVASGTPWRSHRVRQGRVLYLAAEGSGGVTMRLRAQNEAGLGWQPIGILADLPNFLNNDDITEVIKSITAAGGYDLVIIDTWAQVISGADENSGQDVSKALANVRKIQKAVGCMTLLVHHSGKDATRGGRGWSGLKAAADVELEVVRYEGSDLRVMRASKQKDGDDTLAWGFALKPVFLGKDADGDDLISLVPEARALPSDEEMEQLAKGHGEDKMSKAIEATVMALFADEPASNQIPVDEFVAAVFTHWASDRTAEAEKALRDRLLEGTKHAKLAHGSVEVDQFG